jgi:Ca-activated chloride channel family protein
MKGLKIFLIALIILSMLGVCIAMNKTDKVFLNKEVTISYEGKSMAFYDVNGERVYPITYDGTTYLPLRALSALFDEKIKWDQENRAIYIGQGEISKNCAKETKEKPEGNIEEIEAIINGDVKVYYNDKFQLFFDANDNTVLPITYNGTTYLPVRALSNLFNRNISWDEAKKEVAITKESSYSVERGSFLGGMFTKSSAYNMAPQMDMAMAAPAGAMMSESTIGLSVGGAKDANNFRENIKDGYFPISTDITYNGLFYDYMFDITTQNGEKVDDLFSPAYSTAISKDPVSNKNEYYMTVGLNSNIKESDFARKKLNLVVVLDISGSMSSYLDEYYYDAPFKDREDYQRKTNMKAAAESLNSLLDHLKDDDRFGLVLFDSTAEVQKELTQVSKIDLKKFKGDILEIAPRGGTNFEAGYKYGTALYNYIEEANPEEYENRIIVITDAMPNTGITKAGSLMNMVDENSKKGIYTSFIGVGVDFNTKLIEELADVKGANYYSVHSSEEFEKRMVDEFEYMVTPLVFDLSLDIDSDFFSIEAVYGSDTKDKLKGNIMHVNTLFPSKSEGGEVKGGIVLVKLKAKDASKQGNLQVKVSYQDRNGKDHKNAQTVTFRDTNEEYYENTGIRKGILLTRYVNAMKNWILYERSEHREKRFYITPVTGICDCIILPPEVVVILGEHERTSVKLSVSDEYKEIFRNLKSYIEAENKEIKDDTLKQEIEIIDLLLEA